MRDQLENDLKSAFEILEAKVGVVGLEIKEGLRNLHKLRARDKSDY